MNPRRHVGRLQINYVAVWHVLRQFSTFLKPCDNLLCFSVNKTKLGIRRIVRKHLPSEEGVPSLSKGREEWRGEGRTLNLIRITAASGF